MTEENYIQVAVTFAELIRSTLGPKGMNKMVVSDKGIVLTNDGATIIRNVKGGNPIVDLFKDLATSQENAVGDGTTTTTILAGQLLQNALILMNKGIHPTIIINGYNMAKLKSMEHLNNQKQKCEKDDLIKIVKTTFGTKIPPEQIINLTDLLQNVKNFKNLKRYKIPNSPDESRLFNGFAFSGFTINDRMKNQTSGKIAILDFPSNIEFDDIKVTSTEELDKLTKRKKEIKREIVNELVKQKVKCVFYTDTNPEFESYLTNQNIMGVVIFNRENVDNVSQAVNAKVCSSVEDIKSCLGQGEVEYLKQSIGNKGHLFVGSTNSKIETLIIHGQSPQLLDEIERAILDVLGILKNETDYVIGAGAIEISTSLYLREFANQIGGKEQLAIEKFAESLESIPMIIAENAGLDAIDVLTNLKTIHKQNQNFGVDLQRGISDAKARGIIEPVLIKIYAINSATNVANLILKTDKILQG